MTVVVRSLRMHIERKKVSSCYKEHKVQNIPIFVLQLSLSVSMYDRRQQSNLLQNIHIQSMRVLFVLHIDCTWICFYLPGTYYSQFSECVFCRFIWPGWEGKPVCVFSCFCHILSIWWERALQPEHFLTAGLHHCRLFFLSNSSLHSALKSHWVPAQQCFNFWILKPAGMVRMEYFKQQKRHLVWCIISGALYIALERKALCE